MRENTERREGRAGGGGKSLVNQACYEEEGKEGKENGDVTRAGASLAKVPRDPGEGSEGGSGYSLGPRPLTHAVGIRRPPAPRRGRKRG